jgi:hypothetical protein
VAAAAAPVGEVDLDHVQRPDLVLQVPGLREGGLVDPRIPPLPSSRRAAEGPDWPIASRLVVPDHPGPTEMDDGHADLRDVARARGDGPAIGHGRGRVGRTVAGATFWLGDAIATCHNDPPREQFQPGSSQPATAFQGVAVWPEPAERDHEQKT